jgi:hypothetical protein
MSLAIHEPSDEPRIDLGTGVDRRVLLAATTLGLMLLTGLVLLCLLTGTPAAPENGPLVAQQTAAPPRERTKPLPSPQNLKFPPHEDPAPETSVAVANSPTPTPKPDAAVAKPRPARPSLVVEPSPSEPAQVVKTPPPPPFKRIHQYGEEDLRKRLAKESREVDIETEKGTTKQLLDQAMKEAEARRSESRVVQDKRTPQSQSKTPPILETIAQRADLKGLPLRNLTECQASVFDAEKMDNLSGRARAAINSISTSRENHSDPARATTLEFRLSEHIHQSMKAKEWAQDVGVRLLVQIFQADSSRVRMQVVKSLADTKGKTAGAALAQRAVFDVDSEVRELAVEALKDRPTEEYRSILLQALRYPWPPVADHAAEALVALKDQKATSDLARLLDEPDPQAPTLNKENKWVVAELVQINHLANCVLCHAPSADKEDKVRGFVPERGKALPVVYYEKGSGDFIRADVTYLKQDFSLMQPVPEPNKWPTVQRFDYLVRTRELSPGEVSQLPPPKRRDAESDAPYPQREAVLWALKQLTGKDLGMRSENWQEYLKKTEVTPDP